MAATLSGYRCDQFVGDLIAGLIVANMLVPQAMAYAMLAGLPPQAGLAFRWKAAIIHFN